MATVQEALTSKLERFRLEISAAEVAVALGAVGLDPLALYSVANDKLVKTALCKYLPELLLIADVSEAQFSVKFDRNAVVKFYSMLCAELGLPDLLSLKPTITNRSNRW